MLRAAVAAAAVATAAARANGVRADTTFYGGLRAQAGCTGTTFDFYELVTQWAPTLCNDGTFPCSVRPGACETGGWRRARGSDLRRTAAPLLPAAHCSADSACGARGSRL